MNVSFRISGIGRVVRGVVLSLLVWGAVWGTAYAQSPNPIEDLELGKSVEGRPIEMLRVGDGPRKLVLVGATHGWPERNTYQLSLLLDEYFRANPGRVPRDVSLYIVPLLNPDGMALQSRRNANNVDLNRNMNTSADDCPENDWRTRINGAYGIKSDTGGPFRESETESRLIRDFLLDADGVIFFHSNAGVVFPACDHAPSQALSKTFANAADYDYIPKWNKYAITGGMHDWAGGLGIPAATPELVSGSRTEFDQNLAGVRAVLANAEELLAEPSQRTVDDLEIQPVIWRAWRAWGGRDLFGAPLAPPQQRDDGWVQAFEKGLFEYRPQQSDTRFVVQLSQLNEEALRLVQLEPAPADQSDIEIDAVLGRFRRRNAGPSALGDVITAPQIRQDRTGADVVRQAFQRGVLERPVDSASLEDVRLLPQGYIFRAQIDAVSVESSIQAR